MPALPQGLYPAAAVKAIDAAAIAAGIPGVVLMKRAARAALALISEHYPHASLWVFCGGGNNGGDGYALAGLARAKGICVTVYWAEDPTQLQNEAAQAYAFAQQEQVSIQPLNQLPDAAPEHLVIVDALLGIGLKGAVRPATAALIARLNQYSAPKVALDIPSGLCADTGRVLGEAIIAAHTLCFVALKPGLFTGRGPALCGKLKLDDLNIASEHYPTAPITRIDFSHCAERLPHRAADAHKGHSGHVLVVGGDAGMGGAGLLSSEAALKIGAGFVSLATRAEHVLASLVRQPEIMAKAINTAADLAALISRASVLALGPGLGQQPWGQQLYQAALTCGKPLVLDADGLNLLAKSTAGLSCPNPCIITPHPAEAARLLGVTADEIQQDRIAAAQALAAKTGAVVVLKGAGTLVASGAQVFIATVGNPMLATAGSGDVLCGMIAGLWAQGISALDAALLGVCVHGAVADFLVAQQGMRGHSASDLVRQLPQFFAACEAQ
ncbi:MAG TPA: NAD(P)H-hydrate dehydratase [Cellvibrionaceae bacterium]